MAKQKGTEVATQGGGELMPLEEKPDWITDSARGSEEVGAEDIVIPRLELIQALSPQMKDGDPKYNPEAKAGMLVNSVTGQLYGKNVMCINIKFIKQYLVWKKRKWIDDNGREQTSDGGFFGAYNTIEEAEARMNEEVKKGTPEIQIEIVDTPQHYCLIVNPDSKVLEEVMISLPRTKAKISRQWNSMIRLAGGDRFARVYGVTTALEKKAGKGDFYNFAIAQGGWATKAMYDYAEKLYEAISSGARKVVMDIEGAGGEEEGHGTSEM